MAFLPSWLGQNAFQKLRRLIWFLTGAQARPSSPNVTVSQLVEITSATSNTQWNTQNIQWNTQNTQKSTTEMSQWSVMSWNANQISIIAEIPVQDEDFVFKFNLVLDISRFVNSQFLISGNSLLAYCLLPNAYCLLPIAYRRHLIRLFSHQSPVLVAIVHLHS